MSLRCHDGRRNASLFNVVSGDCEIAQDSPLGKRAQQHPDNHCPQHDAGRDEDAQGKERAKVVGSLVIRSGINWQRHCGVMTPRKNLIHDLALLRGTPVP